MDAGFIGKTCNEETDECEPNPCQNDGICTDKHLDFDCDCPLGKVSELISRFLPYPDCSRLENLKQFLRVRPSWLSLMKFMIRINVYNII